MMSVVRWRGPGSIGLRNRRGICQSSLSCSDQDEETVGAGRKPAFDGEEIAEGRLARSLNRRRRRELRPFARAAQRIERHKASLFGLLDRTCKRKPDAVPWWRRRFAKHHNGGRHQSVRELHIRWAEAMNMQERHAFGEIAAKGRAVIHIHEFRGDEPDAQAPALPSSHGTEAENSNTGPQGR